MKNILMIIKTSGLVYDDRLRKECKTLLELGQCVKIIALEDGNQRDSGLTEEVPFRTISLFSRKILPRRQGLAIKTLEIYMHFVRFILTERPDVLWIHNIEMAGLVPIGWLLKKLGLVRRLVWDQHELPAEKVTDNLVLRRIFKFILNYCDIIVSANRERREFLLRKLEYDHSDKLKVIENYVDEVFYELPHGVLPEKLKSWLDSQEYILAQGGGDASRFLNELVDAVMGIKDIKLIVVGPFAEEEIFKLRAEYKNFDGKIFFTGWVLQFELVNYIDNAVASIVLYNAEKRNSCWCASNRLYQALARGVPVIVGSNPPMRNLVEMLKCGVVLQYDGRSASDIRQGVHSILRRHADYKEKAIEHKRAVSWESQKMTIGTVVGLAAGDLS